MMNLNKAFLVTAFFLLLNGSLAWADDDPGPYTKTLKNFRGQPETAPFFSSAVGYAVFPTIGKGGIGIGGAYGPGRAYKNGVHVGDIKMGQVSIGWQFGGQAYSEIIFFQNAEVFDEFADGDFEFGADASAVALTAGAQASASTKGATASAGSSAENTEQAGADWHRGMAVFTIAKGGLMVQATIGGQGFDYKPVGE
jgi:lipid-binding SYLF domain-containing protein